MQGSYGTSPLSLAQKIREARSKQPMTVPSADGPRATVPSPTTTPGGGVRLGAPTPTPRPTLGVGRAATATPPRSGVPTARPVTPSAAPVLRTQPTSPAPVPAPRAPMASMLQQDEQYGSGRPMLAPDGDRGPDMTTGLRPGQSPVPDGGAEVPAMLPTPMPAPAPAPAAGELPVAATGAVGDRPILLGPDGAGAAPGAGGGLGDLGPLNERIRSRTMGWLDNPSPYDDELFQREVDRARLAYDEQTEAGNRRIGENLARRGVDFGSIAGRDFSDWETSRARGFDDILTGMLSDRARGIADARNQALNAGMAERGYYDGRRDISRDQEIQRLQLEEAIRSGRVGEDQAWLQMLLGGYGNAGGLALDGAGMQAGASAGASGGLATLAQLLGRYYGTQGTALPAPTGP